MTYITTYLIISSNAQHYFKHLYYVHYVCVCVYVDVYIYIYIYTHTHTKPPLSGAPHLADALRPRPAVPGGPALVMQALGGTALVFFGLSAYALTTRKDFSYMGGFLMVGLLVAVVAMIANIFLAIPALSLTISAAVVMIMSGLILFDTSRIINGGETNYIRATVSLYLDIYNLFIHLLHLLTALGGDD